MTCSAAQRRLSTERDGTLPSSERAALASHLAECSDCRQAQAALTAVVEHWRTATKHVAVPDSQRAWQDIRREIRATSSPQRQGLPRWALPATATAVLLFAATLAPRWLHQAKPPTAAGVEIARADFVETANDTSSMVYVDDKSGWLVIWAVDNRDKM